MPNDRSSGRPPEQPPEQPSDQPSVLIVGASRGIGLELAEQYNQAGWSVHATTRTPATPGRLGELKGNLTLHELDVRNTSHIASLAKRLSGCDLDVVIHNAGVHDRNHSAAEVMAINADAPFRVLEPLLDILARASRPRLVLVTSQLGARRGRTDKLDTYGESKAVLNDRFRAVEASWGSMGISAIVLHPGWVRTDMGGASAPLSAADSARGIRALVESMDTDHHGGFWTWDGRRHPW